MMDYWGKGRGEVEDIFVVGGIVGLVQREIGG